MCLKRLRRFLMGKNKAAYTTVDFYSMGIDGEDDTEMWTVNGKTVAPMSGVELKVGSIVTFYHPYALSYEVVYYNEEEDFWWDTIGGGVQSIEVTKDLVYISALYDDIGGGGGSDIYYIDLSVTADTISWNDPYVSNYTYDNPALYVVSCNGMELCSAYSYEGSTFPRDAIDFGQNTGTFAIAAYYNGVLVGMGSTTYG